jgi:glutathione S-transferase
VNLFLLHLDEVPAERSPYMGRQGARIRSCLSFIDAKLAVRTTFHQGTFGPLDIALMCALQWLQFRDRYPVHEHNNLSRFVAAHAARPSLAATHPSLAANAAPPKTPAK